MQPIEINDPAEIEAFLSKIALTGKGFTTDCLLMEVFDAGLDYPDYLKAEGEDLHASYDGKSPAWPNTTCARENGFLWFMENPEKTDVHIFLKLLDLEKHLNS